MPMLIPASFFKKGAEKAMDAASTVLNLAKPPMKLASFIALALQAVSVEALESERTISNLTNTSLVPYYDETDLKSEIIQVVGMGPSYTALTLGRYITACFLVAFLIREAFLKAEALANHPQASDSMLHHCCNVLAYVCESLEPLKICLYRYLCGVSTPELPHEADPPFQALN